MMHTQVHSIYKYGIYICVYTYKLIYVCIWTYLLICFERQSSKSREEMKGEKEGRRRQRGKADLSSAGSFTQTGTAAKVQPSWNHEARMPSRPPSWQAANTCPSFPHTTAPTPIESGASRTWASITGGTLQRAAMSLCPPPTRAHF